MKFSDTELGVISNALRVAAETFRTNTSELQANYGASHDAINRLAEQFARQEIEARKLYDKIATETGHAS